MQDHSVNDQHTFNLQWAKRNGYKIVKSYVDDGISGKSASKRPSFLRMIDDAAENGWDAVLVYDSSRFARNLMEFLAYKKMLQENGVQLIAVTEPQIDDDMALFYDAINGASNEMYLRKLSRDVSRGILEMTKRGIYSGRSPFGYAKPVWEPNYIIVDDEIKWVKYIFECVRDKVLYKDILSTLKQNGVKTHAGNDFDNRTIYRIIKNKVYKGVFDFSISGVDLVDIKATNIPAAIDTELWNAANAVIYDRASKKKFKEKPLHIRRHWLSSHVVCGSCGSALCYARKKNWAPRFQCKGYSKGLGCTASVKVEIVEQLVLDKMRDVFTAPATDYIKNIKPVAPKNNYDFDSEISKVKMQLTRAKKAYLAEIDTLEEYKENKERLTGQIKELENRKAAAASPAVIDIDQFRSKVMNAVDVLQSDASMEEKMNVADSLIDKVIVDIKAKYVDLYFFA